MDLKLLSLFDFDQAQRGAETDLNDLDRHKSETWTVMEKNGVDSQDGVEECGLNFGPTKRLNIAVGIFRVYRKLYSNYCELRCYGIVSNSKRRFIH